MKIGIDMGHTLTGAGTGAIGIVKETDKNREVGNRLISMLREKGHTVINCTVDKSNNDLKDRVNLANKQNLDLFLSIHLNSFSSATANGVETFSYAKSGKGHDYAVKIQNELVKATGWHNRGKKEANFYVLKNTNASAVLVELGFVTSKKDMDLWNTEKIAKALFKAVIGNDYIKTNSGTQAPSMNSSNIYRIYADSVQQGTAYANIDNILKQVEVALKSNAAIIEIKRK